jgi:GntR family transcriptional repressor for pyruvate dehydrogenase complex
MPAKGSRSVHPGFSKLKLVPRSAQVREQLEASIRRGEFSPGDRLPSERELTEIFGVSRVSVREAIRSLEAIGLVEVRQGYGCVVSDPRTHRARDLSRWLALHRDEALDLLLVRGALDEIAAAEAASRADEEAIAGIREANDRFRSAVGDADTSIRDLSDLDVAFHVSIAEASGSELLTNLLSDLHRHIADASREISYAPADAAEQSAAEHDDIVRAIEAGDADSARRAAAKHIVRVRELVARGRADDVIGQP